MNNNPYNQNPYFNGAPFTQTQSPFMPPQQTNQQRQSNIIFTLISGEEEARAFLLPLNAKAVLMDFDNKRFYYKSTDELGRSSMRRYGFDEIEDVRENSNVYAKSEDLRSLSSRITKLEELLNNGRGNSETTEGSGKL